MINLELQKKLSNISKTRYTYFTPHLSIGKNLKTVNNCSEFWVCECKTRTWPDFNKLKLEQHIRQSNI
jgi:hypothetical protein